MKRYSPEEGERASRVEGMGAKAGRLCGQDRRSTDGLVARDGVAEETGVRGARETG